MFRFRLIAFASCLALAACSAPLAGTGSTGGGTAPTGAASTAIDDKAMYAAEALYNVPAQAYVVANANGKLTPALKLKLKPLLIDGYNALVLVRAAFVAGNATSFADAVSKLTAISAAINNLIPT